MREPCATISIGPVSRRSMKHHISAIPMPGLSVVTDKTRGQNGVQHGTTNLMHGCELMRNGNTTQYVYGDYINGGIRVYSLFILASLLAGYMGSPPNQARTKCTTV